MEFDLKILEKSFRFCGLLRESLYNSLREMGTGYLQKNAKKSWNKDTPALGYSYEIAEFLFFYVAPQGSKFMKVWVPAMGVYAWFVQWPDNTVVDLSTEHFIKTPDYGKAKPATFQKDAPTKATKRLAKLMGFSDEDRDDLNVPTKTKTAKR